MEERYLGIKMTSWYEMRHMALRTALLAFLTIAGFQLLDYLVESGMADRFSLVHRFPEFIMLLSAAAKFTFIKMSLYWIQFGTQVRNDQKEAMETANSTPMGAAFVHLTNTLSTVAHLAVFLFLMYA